MMKKVISVALVVAMLFSLTTLFGVNAYVPKDITLDRTQRNISVDSNFDSVTFKTASVNVNSSANLNVKVLIFDSGLNSISGTCAADEVIWNYTNGNTPKVTNYDFLTDGKKLEIKVDTKIKTTDGDITPVNVLYSGDISKLNGAKFHLISDDIKTTAEIIVNGDSVAYNNRQYTLKADNNKLYLLVSYVIFYSGKLYETIPDALSDIGSSGSGTITLMADYRGNFDVSQNQNIILNLNNFVYTFEKGLKNNDSCYVSGRLSIVDGTPAGMCTTKYFIDNECLHGKLVGETCTECDGGIASPDSCYETQVDTIPEFGHYMYCNGGVITGNVTYSKKIFNVQTNGTLGFNYICIVGCYTKDLILAHENSSVIIKNSFIAGNFGQQASLVTDNQGDWNLLIDNCEIIYNSSLNYGVIKSEEGKVVIRNSKISDNIINCRSSYYHVNAKYLTLKGNVQIFANIGKLYRENLKIFKNGNIDISELNEYSKISCYSENSYNFITGGDESLVDCFECPSDGFYFDYDGEGDPAGIGLVACTEYAEYKSEMIEYIKETFNPDYNPTSRALGDIYFAKYNRNLSLKANIANIAKIVSKLNLEAAKDAAEYLNEEVTEIRDEGKSTSLIEICSLVANKTRDAFETGAAFTWDFILTCVKNLWALIF